MASKSSIQSALVRYTSSEAKVSPNHLLSPILVFQQVINIIVFKHVSGPRLRFWILKNKNEVILIKIKIKIETNELQPGFVGSAGSYQVMTFFIFSSTWPGFSLVSTGSRAGFKTIINIYIGFLFFILICSIENYYYYYYSMKVG